MNLIEQANVLKGLRDEDLQMEMKTPSGGAPPWLIATEVTRRKDMRQRYEGELARRKPQTTVVEDLANTPTPAALNASMGPTPAAPGGIASAPVQGFARGGIVEAAHYAAGGQVDYGDIAARYNEELGGLEKKRDTARALALIAAAGGIVGGGHSNTLRNVGGGLSAFADSYGSGLQTIDSRETDLLRGLTDIGRLQNSDELERLNLSFRQSEAGRLATPSYAQTPIFLFDEAGGQHLAQPSTGGGYLIDGKMHPGVPAGWSVTNRPVALEVKDTGTNLTTVNTNLGPNAGATENVAPIDVSGAAFDKALGEGLGAQITEARTAATDAQLSLAASEEALNLLDKGMITGFGADFRVGMGKALQQAGIHLADDEIANTEAFVATRALEVGRLIKLFGAGTGLSDADREYATKAAGGSVAMNEESIRRIIDINNRAARNVIEKYNTLVAPLAGRGSIPLEIIPGGDAPTAAPVTSGSVGNVQFTVEPD